MVDLLLLVRGLSHFSTYKHLRFFFNSNFETLVAQLNIFKCVEIREKIYKVFPKILRHCSNINKDSSLSSNLVHSER
jgi:hypothetical protein